MHKLQKTQETTTAAPSQLKSMPSLFQQAFGHR